MASANSSAAPARPPSNAEVSAIPWRDCRTEMLITQYNAQIINEYSRKSHQRSIRKQLTIPCPRPLTNPQTMPAGRHFSRNAYRPHSTSPPKAARIRAIAPRPRFSRPENGVSIFSTKKLPKRSHIAQASRTTMPNIIRISQTRSRTTVPSSLS